MRSGQGFDADSRWAGETRFWLSRTYAALGRDAEAAVLSRARGILSRSVIASDARLLGMAASTR
jgi:hypothetical protein